VPNWIRNVAELASIVAISSVATAQRVELVRALDGEGDEHAVGVAALADGCVVSGFVALDTKTDVALLERLDREGEVVWRRALPGGGDAALWNVVALPDGSFVAAGWSKSARGDLDAFCVRVSSAGDVAWSKSYEGAGDDRLWSLDLDGDTFVAAGECAAAGRSSALVLRIGLDGELRERRTHGEAEVERVFAVQCTPDHGYVLAGLAGSGPREGPDFDARIAAYDSKGAPLWKRDWGGAGFDVAHDIARGSDGTLHVVGYTDAGKGRGTDVFLLTLSAGGEIASSHTNGSAFDDRAVHLEMLKDGATAIVGYTRRADDSDIVVRLVDRTGVSTWEQRFGGREQELGRSLAAAPDGTLFVVGHSRSYGPRERSMLIRLGLS
jgi:hypothetical protein